jgi:hypothetical protein
MPYRTTATGIELSRILIPPARSLHGSERTGHRLADGRAAAPHQPDLHGTRDVRARGHIDGLQILNRTESMISAKAMAASLRPCGIRYRNRLQIHADFIVGCDGARSLVRRRSTPTRRERRSSARAIDLYPRPHPARPDGPARSMTLSLNPRRCGTVVAIDGRDKWLIHNHLNRVDLRVGRSRRPDRAILGVAPDLNTRF